MHYLGMPWTIVFHPEFDAEYDALPEATQDELVARLQNLREHGPQLGRPNVDTLEGSSFPNMRELRFRLDGLWRFAFAFDPQQQAVILVGGDKEGVNQKKFYKTLIRIADARFAKHVAALRAAKEGS